MAAEDFFTRWSKKKTDAADVTPAAAGENSDASSRDRVLEVTRDDVPQPLPTQQDVEKLTRDSDYSVFMAQGVDESVRRSAMKKLFSDPHFNIMDGLDVYIEDFTKFEPITPAMLASLSHAKNLLDPLSQLQAPMMRLLDVAEKEEDTEEPTTTKAIAQNAAEPVDEIASADHENDSGTEKRIEPNDENEQNKQETGENGATRSVNDV
jgi:hypothetical protein